MEHMQPDAAGYRASGFGEVLIESNPAQSQIQAMVQGISEAGSGELTRNNFWAISNTCPERRHGPGSIVFRGTSGQKGWIGRKSLQKKRIGIYIGDNGSCQC